MNRKTLKLLSNPRIFVRDMVNKRTRQVRERLPRIRHVSCERRFSVVSAVYDVEPYLDDFLRSLVRQTVDFERHIEVILVDDGSRDGSAEVIARWQAAHPGSIRYIRKENGGQASARNLGLEHATGDWITFIDPDDFVDERYFQRVDELLSRPDARKVVLVACKLTFERDGKKVDAHPLRSQFDGGDTIVPVGPSSTHIQLSSASAFFRRDLLDATHRRFDEKIRPVFEDGHLIGRYLVENPGGAIGVCARAKYFYRKRGDGSSTLDGSWTHAGRFGVVLERGYLDLLRASSETSEQGRAALWAQRTVLYELCWHLSTLVDHPERLAFLSPEQVAGYEALVRECFTHIEESTIHGFELGGVGYDTRFGMLAFFKAARPPRPQVFIDRFDEGAGCLRMRSFHADGDERPEVRLDGVEIAPSVEKVCRRTFLDALFVNERITWLPAQERDATLTARVGQVEADLQLARVEVRRSLSVESIATALCREPDSAEMRWYDRIEHQLATTPPLRQRYGNCFVFIDRDSQADDNAEHLYRYVMHEHPELNAFFLLRRESPDWPRLEREGFRLIPFGSFEHRVAMINARHLVSSQADHYVLAFPTVRHRRTLQRSRFTFLQHGVIKDDLSSWLNTKPIDCFVTASPAEYASIVGTGSAYRFTEREVRLTGLPRHDALGAGNPQPDRTLLIMPTWREALVGGTVRKSAVRVRTTTFAESDFAQRWRRFLHSPGLRRIATQHGYHVQFFPHANLDAYLDWFDAPSFVETLSNGRGASMQRVLRRAAVLITDYSSVAFELAYLRRPVLYYQFDRELVFGAGLATRPGYYDYDRDGFGPVCFDEPALLEELERLVRSNAAPAAEHLRRMDGALAFRDGHSCQRALDAILALDRPVTPGIEQ